MDDTPLGYYEFQAPNMTNFDTELSLGLVDPILAESVFGTAPLESAQDYEPLAPIVGSNIIGQSPLSTVPHTTCPSLASTSPETSPLLPKSKMKRISRQVPACTSCSKRKTKCSEDTTPCHSCKARGEVCVRMPRSDPSAISPPTARRKSINSRRTSIGSNYTAGSEPLTPNPQHSVMGARVSKPPNRLKSSPKSPPLASKPSSGPRSEITSPLSNYNAVVAFHNGEKLIDLLTNETAPTARAVLHRLRETKDVAKTVRDFGEDKIGKTLTPGPSRVGLGLTNLARPILPPVLDLSSNPGFELDFNDFVSFSSGLNDPAMYTPDGAISFTNPFALL